MKMGRCMTMYELHEEMIQCDRFQEVVVDPNERSEVKLDGA